MTRTLAAAVLIGVVLTACADSGTSSDASASVVPGQYGTWAWDGSDWRQSASTAPHGFQVPPDSSGVGAAGRLIYLKDFGGLVAANPNSWGASKWNGADWVADDATLPDPPPPAKDVSVSSLILDEATGQFLYLDRDGKSIWIWSHGAWVSAALPEQLAIAKRIAWPVYDPYRQEVIILASQDDDPFAATWVWDGHALIKRSSNPQIDDYVTVPDEAGHMLAFGGHHVYSWDGNDWSFASSRSCLSDDILSVDMAYDRAHKQLIAVGVDAKGKSHTWQWQQGTWKTLLTKSSPPRAWYSNLVYDPMLPGLVLIAGPWPGLFPPYFHAPCPVA